jgi:DNA modification methylase
VSAAPFALHVGDARDVLAAMPGASADCIVTSPPYWGKAGLRTPRTRAVHP